MSDPRTHCYQFAHKTNYRGIYSYHSLTHHYTRTRARTCVTDITPRRYSERSKSKCIGITIETRPDYCLKQHLSSMLSYGCTRLEIGVQVCAHVCTLCTATHARVWAAIYKEGFSPTDPSPHARVLDVVCVTLSREAGTRSGSTPAFESSSLFILVRYASAVSSLRDSLVLSFLFQIVSLDIFYRFLLIPSPRPPAFVFRLISLASHTQMF
jgi:hypothetical protein